MINLVWSGLLTLLLLSGCGWNGTPSRSGEGIIPLTSIEIVAESTTIAASHTIAAKTSTKFKVNGNFSGLFTRDITDQAVWSSASPTVAGFVTALNPNRVTGHIPGDAILTATVGGVSGTFALKVSAATIAPPLAITPAASTLPKGMTTQFTVNGTFNDGTTQDLTFDAAWVSSDTLVATVSDDPVSKGLAKAIADTGAATITATFDGVNGSAVLTATAAVLQSVTITAVNTRVLSISKVTNNFTATGHYSDGTAPDITGQAAWTSSNLNVAMITANGATVTTLAEGPTSIIATLAGVSGTSDLTVTGGNLNSITLAPSGARTLVKGTVERLTVTGIFDNQAQRDITGMVAWTSADPSLATVTPAGGNLVFLNALEVTASTAITATVTAASGPKTATVIPAVIAPALQSVAITPTTFPTLISGTSTPFALTATFSDGTTQTTQDVTYSSSWSSSDATKATVGNTGLAKGRVTGVATGTPDPIISATFGGQTATVPVPVTAPTLQGLTISDISALSPGRQVNFTVTANFTNGTSKDVTKDIPPTAWMIDNTNVAVFPDRTNSSGQMVAVDSGTATLTVTFGGLTLSKPITVQ